MAATIARDEMSAESPRIAALRGDLEAALLHEIPGAYVLSPSAPRLPNTSDIRFAGVDADGLLMATPTVAASTGSACSSSSLGPSHVLLAMGLTYAEAQQCVRFSLGRFTTSEEISRAAASIAATAHQISERVVA